MKLQGAWFNNYEEFKDDNSRALNRGRDPVQLYRSQAHEVDPDVRHIHSHISSHSLTELYNSPGVVYH